MITSSSIPWDTGNATRLRNISAILMSLLNEGVIYRIKLAHRLSLSATTITNLVDDLLAQGIIEEANGEDSEEEKRRGRPLAGLQLVKDARYVLGVHIGIGYYRIGLFNLLAETKNSLENTFNISQGYEAVLDAIAADAKKLVSHSSIRAEKILGAGVGASGLVDFDAGINIVSQNLGWHNVPISSFLKERLGMPVVVDNVVRAMAMGEWLFGHGRGTRSLAIVNGQVGVGAGLILDGKILRGSTFGAGELGHFSMLPEIGELCRCGKRGCLETLVSTVVLMSQTEKMIRAHPGTPLALAYNCAQNDGQRVACIFDAARARDQWAEPIVEKSAFYLGVALANLVNLFDPDMIVLNGIFCQAADLYLPVAEKTMRANAYAGIGDRVKMLATSFGANAGMVGAAALSLLYHFYRPIEY